MGYFYEEMLNEVNYNKVKPNLRFLIHIFVVMWIAFIILMLPVFIIAFCISWTINKILYKKDE
jgi:hypothetical protein